MGLVIQIACGILLAQFVVTLFDNKGKKLIALIGTLFDVIAFPFKVMAWLIRSAGRFVAWICRLIDSPRQTRSWRIGAYYGLLALPSLTLFCLPICMMVPGGLVSRPDIHPVLDETVSIISLGSLVFSIFLAVSFLRAGDTRQADAAIVTSSD